MTVVVAGETEVVTTDEDGNWSATFDGDDFPADGTYTAEVTVVEADGTTTGLVGQTVVIDTTPAEVDYSEGTISSGDRINAADHGAGTIRISGSGEAGSRVEVTIDGTMHGAQVGDNGQWFVDFDSSEIDGGDYTAEISVKTIDAFGNTDTFIEYMDIDTILPVIGASSVDGDNGANSAGFVVNKDDVNADGMVAINGTGEAGAPYRVELNNGSGAVRTDTIGDDGNWTANFTLAESGGLSDADGYNVPFTMTSIDDFGNPSLAVQDTTHVDTLADVDFGANLSGTSDHVASAQDFVDNGHNNLILTGTSEPGTTAVRVTMNDFTRDAVVDPDTGEWSVTFEPGTYQAGTHTYEASAISTDEHGNTDTADMTVRVDTEVRNLTVSNRPALWDESYLGLDDAQGGFAICGDMPNMFHMRGGGAIGAAAAGALVGRAPHGPACCANVPAICMPRPAPMPAWIARRHGPRLRPLGIAYTH